MNSDIKNYEKQLLDKMLYQMQLIRRFEEKAAQCYGLKKIGGFCHIYIGQEAVAVGSVAAIDLKKDYVITAYRDHGHALAVGMTANSIMAELFGKITGCSRAKGGSMHLFDADKHFYGGHGIVGAHIPLAAGMALKIKYFNEGGVVLCFFGDGAIHQGSFHETLNMASVWKLPVVYICENNQYGMGTDFRRVSSQTNLAAMADSYSISGRQVDGMDVLGVYDNVQAVVEQVRADNKPVLLEIKTYRYQGHSMSDPATYRTKEEVSKYRENDPIIILKENMINAGLLTEDDFAAIDEKIKKEVADSVDFAEKSPEPEIKTMYEDVLA
jgi:pyruvate dehydrogenase E1 component alpha subunit